MLESETVVGLGQTFPVVKPCKPHPEPQPQLVGHTTDQILNLWEAHYTCIHICARDP